MGGILAGPRSLDSGHLVLGRVLCQAVAVLTLDTRKLGLLAVVLSRVALRPDAARILREEMLPCLVVTVLVACEGLNDVVGRLTEFLSPSLLDGDLTALEGAYVEVELSQTIPGILGPRDAGQLVGGGLRHHAHGLR